MFEPVRGKHCSLKEIVLNLKQSVIHSEDSAAVTSAQVKQVGAGGDYFSFWPVLSTLYGRKNSLLARRKLDRFPYLQYSTITISGPGDTDSLFSLSSWQYDMNKGFTAFSKSDDLSHLFSSFSHCAPNTESWYSFPARGWMSFKLLLLFRVTIFR